MATVFETNEPGSLVRMMIQGALAFPIVNAKLLSEIDDDNLTWRPSSIARRWLRIQHAQLQSTADSNSSGISTASSEDDQSRRSKRTRKSAVIKLYGAKAPRVEDELSRKDKRKLDNLRSEYMEFESPSPRKKPRTTTFSSTSTTRGLYDTNSPTDMFYNSDEERAPCNDPKCKDKKTCKGKNTDLFESPCTKSLLKPSRDKNFDFSNSPCNALINYTGSLIIDDYITNINNVRFCLNTIQSRKLNDNFETMHNDNINTGRPVEDCTDNDCTLPSCSNTPDEDDPLNVSSRRQSTPVRRTRSKRRYAPYTTTPPSKRRAASRTTTPSQKKEEGRRRS